MDSGQETVTEEWTDETVSKVLHEEISNMLEIGLTRILLDSNEYKRSCVTLERKFMEAERALVIVCNSIRHMAKSGGINVMSNAEFKHTLYNKIGPDQPFSKAEIVRIGLETPELIIKILSISPKAIVNPSSMGASIMQTLESDKEGPKLYQPKVGAEARRWWGFLRGEKLYAFKDLETKTEKETGK
jgi:hypothetical protein